MHAAGHEREGSHDWCREPLSGGRLGHTAMETTRRIRSIATQLAAGGEPADGDGDACVVRRATDADAATLALVLNYAFAEPGDPSPGL